MRTIRLRRVAVLFVAALGLVGTMAPSADAATTAAVAVIRGTATLDAGLSYPCVGTSTPNLSKCPSVSVTTATPGKAVQVTGGNTRTVTGFSSSTCVSAGVINGTTTAGICSLTNVGTGTVTGSCGLSSGLVTADITQSENTLRVWVHWVAVGGTLVLTGTVHGLATSGVVGVVQATPLPTTPTNPPTGTLGNSCSGKTATQFEIAGAALAAAA